MSFTISRPIAKKKLVSMIKKQVYKDISSFGSIKKNPINRGATYPIETQMFPIKPVVFIKLYPIPMKIQKHVKKNRKGVTL